MREIEALYVIRLSNGKDYSVKFDKKEMDSFQPNKTVSEVIKSWEDNIQRRYDEAVKAIETGLHPTARVNVPIMITLLHGGEYPTGKYTSERKQLDVYEKRHFKKMIAELPNEFGLMQFIKIV
jgi:hypothetical protein